LIYLDTHVVIWLSAGLTTLFNSTVQNLINQNDLFISPIVRLELQYLYEIKRITDSPNAIVTDLTTRIGLQIDGTDLNKIVSQAMTFSWTRDPFDRIIVANAGLNNHILVTKDSAILANYSLARW
jgi:PIN domain nuclease of toxin-antitoxin system